MIHFGDRDSLDLALVDELPVRKAKEKRSMTQTKSILPWFRKKGKAGALPLAHLEEAEIEQLAPEQPVPDSSTVPQPPRKSSMRVVKNYRDPKSVKLPELSRQAMSRGKAPLPPPKEPPPPVPSDVTNKPSRGMEIRLKHRTIISRVSNDTTDVHRTPPRNKSPSHVRNRHVPVTQPVARKRLSTKLEEAAEILAEEPTPQKEKQVDKQKTNWRQQDRRKPDEKQQGKLEPDHPHKPQLEKEHSFSPTPPAMVGTSGKATPRLPVTWQYAVGTPNSFEQALDDVVRKLDEMEFRPAVKEMEITLRPETQLKELAPKKTDDPKTNQESAPHQEEPSIPQIYTSREEQMRPGDDQTQKLEPEKSKRPSTSFPDHRLQRAQAIRRQRIVAEAVKSPEPTGASAATPKPEAPFCPEKKVDEPVEPVSAEIPPLATKKFLEPAKSLSAEDVTVDHYDRDISDRDVLKGLKLAVSAACDENLDAWLRGKTGLRLRRFLADLKTFEHLGFDDEGENGAVGKTRAGDEMEKKQTENKLDDKKLELVDWKGAKENRLETVGGIKLDTKVDKHSSAGIRRPGPEPMDQKARMRRAERRKIHDGKRPQLVPKVEA